MPDVRYCLLHYGPVSNLLLLLIYDIPDQCLMLALQWQHDIDLGLHHVQNKHDEIKRQKGWKLLQRTCHKLDSNGIFASCQLHRVISGQPVTSNLRIQTDSVWLSTSTRLNWRKSVSKPKINWAENTETKFARLSLCSDPHFLLEKGRLSWTFCSEKASDFNKTVTIQQPKDPDRSTVWRRLVTLTRPSPFNSRKTQTDQQIEATASHCIKTRGNFQMTMVCIRIILCKHMSTRCTKNKEKNYKRKTKTKNLKKKRGGKEKDMLWQNPFCHNLLITSYCILYIQK